MLKVSMTRMELLRLRRRLGLARRGHKLLKDKQEQLLTQFYRLVEESKGFRENLEKSFHETARDFLSAQSGYLGSETYQFLAPPRFQSTLEFHTSRLLNVAVPRFHSQWNETTPVFSRMPLDLLAIIHKYRTTYEEILRLAELETILTLFASEIEKTRRRVNSLEYILIPELEKTTRSIEMRLEESERENFVRLRHIKQQA